MTKLTIKNYIKIDPREIPDVIFERIKNDLTFDNPKYINALKYNLSTWKIPKKKKSYFLSKYIYMPKGYIDDLIQILNDSNIEFKIIDKRTLGKEHIFSYIGELRQYQTKAVLNALKEEMGIITIPCGGGKSHCAMAIIANRRQPTLILVHTKDLMQQWIEMIYNFMAIQKENIGVIASGKYRIKPITIAMTQTLARSKTINYEDLNSYFGQVIFEESHHQPADSFAKVASNFTCVYQLGLSATPYRTDGLSKLIQCYVGKISAVITEDELKAEGKRIKPKIIQRNTNFESDYNYDSTSFNRLIDHLTNDLERNILISEDIYREVSKNHYCLVLSARVEHSKRLNDGLSALEINTEILDSSSPTKKRKEVIGKMNEGKIQVLFATGQLAGEGLDIPRLDRLFLVTPVKAKGKVTQFIGRICRTFEGKKDAIVYDYVDYKIGICQGMYQLRLKNVYSKF